MLTQPSRRVWKCPPALARSTARVASADTSARMPAGHRYHQAHYGRKMAMRVRGKRPHTRADSHEAFGNALRPS